MSKRKPRVSTAVQSKQPAVTQKITRAKASALQKEITIPQKKADKKDDFVFLLDENAQMGFHENFRQYRERKNVSCVDKNELNEDNFAPQENPAINKVSQKIVIDQEFPALFSMRQNDSSTLTINRNNQTIELMPSILQYESDSEDDLEILNHNHNRLKQSLLSLPRQSAHSERTHSTAGTTTEQIEIEIPMAKEKQQFKPKRQAKLKNEVQKDAILTNINKCLDSLQESAIPDEVLCRDDEKKQITKFIEDGLKNGGQSQALYISGVPGIGKTASVLEVQRKLSQKKKNYKFIYTNAMNYGLPENIYTTLLTEITGIEKTSRNQACLILTELFTTGHLPDQYKQFEKKMGKLNRVVLIDECDNLITPNQQVLYNLVDWPSYKSAKLTIIMIANTMDFPERLKPKLQSRLGNHRLVFRPYSSIQIEQILQQRLNTKQLKEVFGNTTLTYIGKKIATISTDIRKTLSVCRTSIELARDQYLNQEKVWKQVEIEHVKQAYNKIYDKPYHACLRQFSQVLKILLLTIAVEIHYKGYNYASFMNVYSRYNQLSKREQMNYNDLNRELLLLRQSNLIEIKEQNLVAQKNQTQINKLKDSLNKDLIHNITDIAIQLKISIDDIKNALADDPLFKQYQQFF